MKGWLNKLESLSTTEHHASYKTKNDEPPLCQYGKMLKIYFFSGKKKGNIQKNVHRMLHFVLKRKVMNMNLYLHKEHLEEF